MCEKDGWLAQDYDFLLDGERCGSLEWERGFFPRALAETGGGAWWIGRRGWGSTEHEVLLPGTEGAIATYCRRFIGADEINFPDGRTVHWRRVRAFSLTLRYGLYRDGEALLEFSWLWSLAKRRVRIDVWPAASRMLKRDDLPLLVLLGSYVFIRVATAQSLD